MYSSFFKRFFDIVLSLLAIILLSPLFLIIWILHKIFIRGGRAIFTQYRPGLNGKIFKIDQAKNRDCVGKTPESVSVKGSE